MSGLLALVSTAELQSVANVPATAILKFLSSPAAAPPEGDRQSPTTMTASGQSAVSARALHFRFTLDSGSFSASQRTVETGQQLTFGCGSIGPKGTTRFGNRFWYYSALRPVC